MKKNGDKWRERLAFTLLFLLLTLLAHYALEWAQAWIHPNDPYKVPEGRAAKVFQAGELSGGGPGNAADRLRLFFWYGE